MAQNIQIFGFAPSTLTLPGQEFTQQGQVNSALIDGTTVSVTYAASFAFPVSTDNVALSVTGLSNSADLVGKEIILSMTTTGFTFAIPGGAPGDTATVNWTAYGH